MGTLSCKNYGFDALLCLTFCFFISNIKRKFVPEYAPTLCVAMGQELILRFLVTTVVGRVNGYRQQFDVITIEQRLKLLGVKQSVTTNE